jgi:hypothetical protein
MTGARRRYAQGPCAGCLQSDDVRPLNRSRSHGDPEEVAYDITFTYYVSDQSQRERPNWKPTCSSSGRLFRSVAAGEAGS